MTDLTPIPADRCPSWCRRDELDDDGMRVHEAVLGFAGPLEVSLRRSGPADGPVFDELQLYDVGGQSTSQSELTMPLDPAALNALAELFREAAVSAGR